MRTRLIRIISAAALGGLLVATIPAAAGAAGSHASAVAPVRPSGEVFTKWGWVTVRTTHTGTYTPAATDRGNSAGKVNVVKQPSVGRYTILFKGLHDDGGAPQVSTLGNSPRTCMIFGWGAGTGNSEEVDVDCYTSSGIPASTRFTVSYLATNRQEGSLAYLFASGSTEFANSQYSFNSTGSLNHIDRSDVGRYLVELGGLQDAWGNVQVTAREGSLTTAGATPAGVNPVTCNAVGWHPAITDQRVEVQCRESHGLPFDTSFTLTFTHHEGLKGLGNAKVAYLWSDKPGRSSYTPSHTYRYSSAGMVPNVSRQGTGRYTVTLPGMPKGGAALVNAYGNVLKRCQIGAIRTTATPQRVQVRCFTFSGVAADAKFTLSYER